MYDFNEQLKSGQKDEDIIYQYLKYTDWKVRKANRVEQRKGIDCFVSKENFNYSIEIKSDRTASKTGNCFIETISVDTNNKLGWGYTCQADYLFYYLPLECLIYLLRPDWIKANIEDWEQKYPTRKIKNKGYYTHGVLLPLYVLEQYCSEHTQIINL